MTVSLKAGVQASQQAVEDLETKLGFRISAPFRNFVDRNDGAAPESNVFAIGGRNNSGVNGFIPVAKIDAERRRIETLPSTAYPVAWAEGGNYVFIDEGRGGEVYFWDHERPDANVRIGADFNDFLSALAPLDLDQIELKPGQVKRAWIDPDFLRRLKE